MAIDRARARALRRGSVSLLVFLFAWELGSRAKAPFIGAVPAPSEVLRALFDVAAQGDYWQSWYKSLARVLLGFAAAVLTGVPFGLLLAVNRTAYGLFFPAFELLRPIPPLAWVPASIIFWPTQELSIAFVTFLGAFYTLVINVVGGARAIDPRYFQAARSMGASSWNVFRRIVLPATLPSIVVGAVVGMGITWEVVVAAEMISGGGSQAGGTAGGGLGFLIWNAYVGGAYAHIVVGMASIGVAGLLSSEALRRFGQRITPWTRPR
jgi:NitT/TauT family transport system permease protein